MNGHDAANLFPLLHGDAYRGVRMSTYAAVDVIPWANDRSFSWLSVTDEVTQHLMRRPVRCDAIPQLLAALRISVTDLTWVATAVPPAAVCPWTGGLASRSQENGSVYFVQGEHGGPIKIGSADHAESRVRTLQVGSPVPLVLLGTMPGGERKERELHKRFAHLRMHSEWFRPDADLLAVIPRAE